MTSEFENLIDSYIQDKVGIVEHFLSIAMTQSLIENMLFLYQENKFIKAKIGAIATVSQQSQIRSDKILWLDRANHNKSENSFLDLMDSFVLFLNQTCYTGITSYEFHYAMYEKGSFYKKHLDQFKSNASRQYTLIFYLNENWQSTDGGELCFYINNLAINVNPTNGKCVFFKSNEIEHEVLLSHAPRMSITGWLRID